MTRFALPRFPLRRTRHQIRNRRLFLEPLDHRVVLTGLTEVIVSEPSMPAELATSEAAAVPDAALTECPAEPIELVAEPVDGPQENLLDVELPTVEIGEPAPEPEIGIEEGGPGGGDPDETGPTIQGFRATFDHSSGEWIFSGTVLDDKSVDGLHVNIAGVVTGQAMVQADGSFELCLSLPPGILGMVTADFTDSDGNPAVPATIFLST